jgi:hydroxyethylthiazole kinase-like uncharacterized protein yjeF
MSTSFEAPQGRATLQRVTAGSLYKVFASRTIEQQAKQNLPAHSLMERAGLAVARLTMAVAPHAKVIWIACGPGNNGGDGYEAAIHLKRWGKTPIVSALGLDDISSRSIPTDAAQSKKAAQDAGVIVAAYPPEQFDVCIDAMFGVGLALAPDTAYRPWVDKMNARAAPVIAVDIPTGLLADTGQRSESTVYADYTLSLLTLKPGLFTCDGKDACGEIWFDALGVTPTIPADAELITHRVFPKRANNSNKGIFGDVGVIGGDCGMTGAPLLAAQAALHAGAGRVYLCILDSTAEQGAIAQHPELMLRTIKDLALESMTIVAGCGGGKKIHAHLQRILLGAKFLVLDADGLNAVAADLQLQTLLAARAPNTSVITPHPLEAARLLSTTAAAVQSNRLGAAQALAEKFKCTAVLKGSGTVVASPLHTPCINSTGNARLATAGTGDVLAGFIAARIAAGGDVFEATCDAVFRQGQVADHWLQDSTLTAERLAQAY